MGFILKLLNMKITKMLLCLLLIAFMASLYFYPDWYIKQYNKAVGCYYVYKGDKAFRDMKYQQAVLNYRKALKYYPEHSKARWNLGNIYVSFENYHEAVSEYEKALKYNPNFMVCRMDLGIILAEELADYDKAIQEYGRVVHSRPYALNIPFVFNNKDSIVANKGIAYYNMGLAYRGKAVYMGENTRMATKYLKKAKEAYEEAEKYLKDDYDNTYNLALTNHLLGDYLDAAKNYCRANNIKPANFESHYNFALLLRTMGMNKESLLEFEKTSMMMDYFNNINRSKYVYGIITEVKRNIMNETGGYDFLKERIDITALSQSDIVYTKGKIVADNQKDLDLNNLLKCTFADKFEEM